MMQKTYQSFKPFKSFGSWLLGIRKRNGLTLQQIADKSHLKTGTVSRIERDQVKVTLLNVFRICDGFDFPPDTLYPQLVRSEGQNDSVDSQDNALSSPDGTLRLNRQKTVWDDPSIAETLLGNNHKTALSDERSPFITAFPKRMQVLHDKTQEPSVLGLRDTFHFLELVHRSPEQSRTVVMNVLNQIRVSQQHMYNMAPFVLEDAGRLLDTIPFYHCDVPYPALTIDHLLSLYTAGGLMIEDDATHCTQQIIAELENNVGACPVDLKRTMQRLGKLSLDQILFDTVFELDAQFNQEGYLLYQYWLAYKIHEGVCLLKNRGFWEIKDYAFELTDTDTFDSGTRDSTFGLTDTDARHVNLLVKLSRWLWLCGLTDVSWIRQYG